MVSPSGNFPTTRWTVILEARTRGEGNTAVLLFLLRHKAADWRKKACNAKSATAGGRLRDEMYTTDRASVAIFMYVCDVTSATGEHFSITS